jgi:hypothetical protein
MVTIAASCFLAGLLLGAWIIHLVSTKRAEVLSAAGQVDLQDKFSAKIVCIVDGDTVQALTPGHLRAIKRPCARWPSSIDGWVARWVRTKSE